MQRNGAEEEEMVEGRGRGRSHHQSIAETSHQRRKRIEIEEGV
jgi:hypothetical protein